MKIEFFAIQEAGALETEPFEVIKFDEAIFKSHVIANMPKIMNCVLNIFHTCKRIMTAQDHVLFFVVVTQKEFILKLKIHSYYERKK